jgi:hypothetical protein
VAGKSALGQAGSIVSGRDWSNEQESNWNPSHGSMYFCWVVNMGMDLLKEALERLWI